MSKLYCKFEDYVEGNLLDSGSDRFVNYLKDKKSVDEKIPDKYKELEPKEIERIILSSFLRKDLEDKFNSENKGYINLNLCSGNIIVFFNYNYAHYHFMLEYKNISLEIKENCIVLSILENMRDGFKEVMGVKFTEPDFIAILTHFIKEKGNEFFNNKITQDSVLRRIKEWNEKINNKIKELLKNNYRNSNSISIDIHDNLFNLEKMYEYNGFIFQLKIANMIVDTSTLNKNISEEEFYSLLELNIKMEKQEQVASEEKRKIMNKITTQEDDCLVEFKKRRL